MVSLVDLLGIRGYFLDVIIYGMHKDLLQTIKGYISLSEEEAAQITTLFQTRTWLKGEYFLRAGQVNRYVGFIERGLVRYYVPSQDQEMT